MGEKEKRGEREGEGNKIVRVITLQCEIETWHILIGELKVSRFMSDPVGWFFGIVVNR